VTPVMELAGPAGAGKTAVLRAIAARDPGVRAGVRVDRVRGLPGVVWHAIALTPALADLLFTDPRWVWPGLRHLGRLRTLPAAIHGRDNGRTRATVLDEGPVFSLARLAVFQRAALGNGWLAREWRSALERAARLLDAVVLLDAPNELLAERIRSRTKSHAIKDGSDRQVFDFLDRYRAAYRDIVSQLAARGHTRVFELDGTATLEQIAREVLGVLEPVAAERRA